MTVSKMISISEFKEMSTCKLHAENHKEQQSTKLMLLKSIEAVYGERYYRLKEGTRKAIDMMCWFASERGFFFASDDYFAERYNVSAKTIRNISKKLRDHGLIVTVYRRSSTQNGRSAPIHLFTEHPYFIQWKEYLSLEDFQTDCQTKNAENPYDSKDQETQTDSTNYLNLNKSFKNIRKEDPFLDDSFTPSHIPQTFVSTVKQFFGEAKAIYKLWGKAKLAHRISKFGKPIELLEQIVVQAFKESIFAYKHGRIKGAFDGYFFGTLRNMINVEKRREGFENHPVLYDFLQTD
ncbi:helix-turn-helix domain-containing protein [Domibacillus epiphyticus]|uniref:Uncharacterized protein n=1 Tax=Domibacillus epiphyticus TaxID=1714355 RepID=A0A1V2A5N8_9BACI|nr:helix-turn-helix domain-containing protein [Domibacillus epiphyticus]OMP66325.1 hypothetical protein BTO28_12745 [Domibacillus epiphyticus]